MADTTFEIRNLDTADEMASISKLLQQVWGTTTPVVGVEMLCATAHVGGYVAAAYDGTKLVGASFGFLARHDGQEALHSHVTGILQGVQHSGLGRQLKNHQRQWAAERGIPWITWTFDPLVRRNAWFNISVLGVHVAEYLVNFYGAMDDAINANDEPDRLVAAWPTDPSTPPPTAPRGATIVEVATPDDIVVLRRKKSAEAMEWRLRVRAELGDRMAAGATVTGFTREGCYVVSVPG
jgi:predicted GNAT superfamily acetyltransferase